MDEGILESELAGDRVVELRVDELRVVGLITCEMGEIVRGDEGPVGGVAQVTESKSESTCMERKDGKKTVKCWET